MRTVHTAACTLWCVFGPPPTGEVASSARAIYCVDACVRRALSIVTRWVWEVDSGEEVYSILQALQMWRSGCMGGKRGCSVSTWCLKTPDSAGGNQTLTLGKPVRCHACTTLWCEAGDKGKEL